MNEEIYNLSLKGQGFDLIDKDFYKLIAEEYDSSKVYEQGDYCIFQYQLYKCIIATETNEIFNLDKWQRFCLTELI